MARSTQFIGLTKQAERFVRNFTLGPDPDPKSKECEDRFALGMFGENIPLRMWAGFWEGKTILIKEVVQDSPWSGGPMIFTNLEMDFLNGAKVTIFQWVHNPTIDSEFDRENGQYWV